MALGGKKCPECPAFPNMCTATTPQYLTKSLPKTPHIDAHKTTSSYHNYVHSSPSEPSDPYSNDSFFQATNK